MSEKKGPHSMLDDEDFKSLSVRKSRISLTFTAIELALYFGFVALIAFNKSFLSARLSGAIPVGIPISVGTILLSLVFTGIYVWWANNKYDVLLRKMRDKAEKR
jgi:uncharacterized membrane protein (DUF485 family)